MQKLRLNKYFHNFSISYHYGEFSIVVKNRNQDSRITKDQKMFSVKLKTYLVSPSSVFVDLVSSSLFSWMQNQGHTSISARRNLGCEMANMMGLYTEAVLQMRPGKAETRGVSLFWSPNKPCDKKKLLLLSVMR